MTGFLVVSGVLFWVSVPIVGSMAAVAMIRERAERQVISLAKRGANLKLVFGDGPFPRHPRRAA